MNRVTTAAVYVRVSTSRQAERDLSLPDQIAQCRAYCEQRGWLVAEIFSEPGASALDDDRPAFQEMIFKATRIDKPFDYVVVHSLSRFSRDSLHSEMYVRQLRKAGVELVSITQDIGADASGEFIRKVLNVFDEHQSRENAKHVHRAMLENSRQGFWNGSRPPFGYDTEIKERRGNKDKKVLVVNDEEARVVRKIFDLAVGADGRPLGVKAIASYFNERGISRRGRRFSTGGVHDILTSSTYHGRHHFNRTDSRNGRARPPSQWVEFPVPQIVDEETFTAVQALLQNRSPRRVAPRIVNGPTLLAGVARCGHCGAALIQNTGKGGLYRYYCCSRKLKEGATACKGLRIRMDRLDEVVTNEVASRILHPERLRALLEAYVRSSASRADDNKERLSRMRQTHKETQAAIVRLLELVEKGVMEAEDPSLKERLVGLKVQRDELARDIGELQKRVTSGEPALTADKIEKFAALLGDRLRNGPPEFRQAYARLAMREVTVTDQEIRISGSKAVLARAAAQGLDNAPPGVLSFVREWRARKDSNFCPPDRSLWRP
ncbi:recombinase family protein [Hyphomicrobium sp.]|uniref:recombinase family protein n=1 Tax=Hyphomicrobium sp. TaxID=82 RepID=UPI003F70F3AF